MAIDQGKVDATQVSGWYSVVEVTFDMFLGSVNQLLSGKWKRLVTSRLK